MYIFKKNRKDAGVSIKQKQKGRKFFVIKNAFLDSFVEQRKSLLRKYCCVAQAAPLSTFLLSQAHALKL